MYTRELLQFGDKVSMLLLLPPSEDFSSSYWPLVGTKELGLTMPLQIFELGRWKSPLMWDLSCDSTTVFFQAVLREVKKKKKSVLHTLYKFIKLGQLWTLRLR